MCLWSGNRCLTIMMDESEAVGYLKSLLNKELRVYTTDTRMFIGDFKCTDNVRRSYSPD